MTNNKILQMLNITKSFPGVKALENVTLELVRGEVLTLLGENGAGKSTLMKILSGVYLPDEGKTLLDGRAVHFKSPREAFKAGISMIYQELNLVPTQSVAQNILMLREPRYKIIPFLIDLKELKRQAESILNEIDLDIDPLKKISEISVAQQQMVAIAKAISGDAKIIVMDEPTAALTENEIEKLFELIKRLKTKGLSIIYISHRLQEVHRVGDRCMVLRDGKFIGCAELKQIGIKDLIRMMIGEQNLEKTIRRKGERGEEVLRIERLKEISEEGKSTLTLHSGEIIGLAGVVGSGRTELAQAIFGIDRFRRERVYLKRKPVIINSPKKAIKMGIGLLPEDRRTYGLFLRLPYCENVVSAAQHILSRFGVTNPSKEKKQARKYQKELKIDTPNIHQVVKLLSGGNQQKTVIAKWLCSQAKIFIFDDPTRGIDVGARREVHNLMNELASSGAAILMISSDLSELLEMSDRIYVMNKGLIVTELDRENATHEKVFKYATQQL